MPTKRDAEPIMYALRKAGFQPELVGSVSSTGRSDHDIDIKLPIKLSGEAGDFWNYPQAARFRGVMERLGFHYDGGPMEGFGPDDPFQFSKPGLVVDIYTEVTEGDSEDGVEGYDPTAKVKKGSRPIRIRPSRSSVIQMVSPRYRKGM